MILHMMILCFHVVSKGESSTQPEEFADHPRSKCFHDLPRPCGTCLGGSPDPQARHFLSPWWCSTISQVWWDIVIVSSLEGSHFPDVYRDFQIVFIIVFISTYGNRPIDEQLAPVLLADRMESHGNDSLGFCGMSQKVFEGYSDENCKQYT